MKDRPVSIRVLMDNVASHPMMKDIPDETVVRYVVEFMRVMGCPFLMGEKTAEVEIRDFKGALPCDFYKEVSVSGPHGEPFRGATATFPEDDEGAPRLTYSIRGGVIHASLPDGVVRLRYTAIMEDEDGFPLLPDNSVALRAMEAYVKMRWFTVLFDMGRASSQSLSNAQQDYAWCAGQCHSEQHRLSMDRMESVTASLTNLMCRPRLHADGFASLGDRERWRTHNGG